MVEDAVIFAANAHRGAKRKNCFLPYIVHPMEVATIASTITTDEEIISAALLHDTIEDTDTTPDDIRKNFGEEVLRLVLGDSEDKMVNIPKSDSWKARKQATIDYIKNKADIKEKIVVFSDKLSNLRSIYRDTQIIGDEVWNNFNMKDKNEHAWYYNSFIEACNELQETGAFKEYCDLIYKIFD